MSDASVGCGDNSCIFGAPGGMATNGGCSCLEGLPREQRLRVRRAVAELRAKLDASETTLAAVREGIKSGVAESVQALAGRYQRERDEARNERDANARDLEAALIAAVSLAPVRGDALRLLDIDDGEAAGLSDAGLFARVVERARVFEREILRERSVWPQSLAELERALSTFPAGRNFLERWTRVERERDEARRELAAARADIAQLKQASVDMAERYGGASQGERIANNYINQLERERADAQARVADLGREMRRYVNDCNEADAPTPCRCGDCSSCWMRALLDGAGGEVASVHDDAATVGAAYLEWRRADHAACTAQRRASEMLFAHGEANGYPEQAAEARCLREVATAAHQRFATAAAEVLATERG